MHYFYEGVECLCRLEKRNWWTAYMEISASFPSLLPHHSSLDSSVFWFTHPPSLYLGNTIHAGYQGLSAYSYPLRCLVARKALLNWGEYQHFALGAALGKHTTHLVTTWDGYTTSNGDEWYEEIKELITKLFLFCTQRLAILIEHNPSSLR